MQHNCWKQINEYARDIESLINSIKKQGTIQQKNEDWNFIKRSSCRNTVGRNKSNESA